MSGDDIRITVVKELTELTDPWKALLIEHCTWTGLDLHYRKAAQTLIYKGRYDAASFDAHVSSVLSGRSPPTSSATSDDSPHGIQSAGRVCEERLRILCSQGSLELPEAGTQCSDCGSRDIQFNLLQTRAADEPMSVFCRCGKCGKCWRM
jgi:DNA-directed RNA polymerase subunit M/transcription elongation factor TFIIS